MRYLIILILFAASCSPSRQFAKLAIAHPELPAKYCVDKYEGKKDTVYKQGAERLTFDTIYTGGEITTDTVYLAGKPIEVTKTIILPGKTIYERSIRVDTVYRDSPELLAKYDLSDIERRDAIINEKAERIESDKWRKIAKKRFWTILGMGAGIALGLFLFIRKKITKVIPK